jgi:hypothetical protein
MAASTSDLGHLGYRVVDHDARAVESDHHDRDAARQRVDRLIADEVDRQADAADLEVER